MPLVDHRHGYLTTLPQGELRVLVHQDAAEELRTVKEKEKSERTNTLDMSVVDYQLD